MKNIINQEMMSQQSVWGSYDISIGCLGNPFKVGHKKNLWPLLLNRASQEKYFNFRKSLHTLY